MKRTLGIALTLSLILVSALPAAVTTFTDRATWLAAAGGTETATEDFSGFVVDTPFNPDGVTVATAIGTVGMVGFDQAFRNFVDVAPFEFGDNNGTTHAACFTNFEEVGTPATSIEIVFNQPAVAGGADFEGAAGSEILAVDFIELGTGTILATVTAVNNTTFMGFVADAGEQIGTMLVRSANLIAGGAGRGFGMDNISLVALQDADLGITKTSNAMGPVSIGANVIFNLAVDNLGPAAATNVVVTDTLDPAFTYVSNDCGAAFVAPTLTWDVGTLNALASAECNLTVAVNDSASNVATVTSDNADPVSSNDSSAVDVEVDPLAIPTLGWIGGGLLALLLSVGGLAILRRR
jgi:uncharacterized repeat protein (TIGR01451 family)